MEPRVPNHRLRKDEFVVPENTDTPLISEPVLEISEDDRTSPEREEQEGADKQQEEEEEEDDDLPDAGAIEEEPSDASDVSGAAASEQASSSSSGDDAMVGPYEALHSTIPLFSLRTYCSISSFWQLLAFASTRHSTGIGKLRMLLSQGRGLLYTWTRLALLAVNACGNAPHNSLDEGFLLPVDSVCELRFCGTACTGVTPLTQAFYLCCPFTTTNFIGFIAAVLTHQHTVHRWQKKRRRNCLCLWKKTRSLRRIPWMTIRGVCLVWASAGPLTPHLRCRLPPSGPAQALLQRSACTPAGLSGSHLLRLHTHLSFRGCGLQLLRLLLPVGFAWVLMYWALPT